jgi:hypothetical protein
VFQLANAKKKTDKKDEKDEAKAERKQEKDEAKTERKQEKEEAEAGEAAGRRSASG